MDEKRWSVYLLRCDDGSLYCGITTNVSRRLDEHQNGTAARYTAGRGPVTLAYTEGPLSHSEALKREYAIKQLSKNQKEALL